MNDLIFNNSEFGELDVFVETDKVYFPATQCAKILGYKNPQEAVRKYCKPDGCVKRSVGVQTGNKADGTPAIQTVDMKYITEGNLYRLIVSSHLPKAEKFESWIFDEVLPTIRKTGGYVSNADMFITTYLPHADEHTKELFRLQLNTITELNNQIDTLNTKIEIDKPLVDFAQHVSDTTDLIDVGELSKIFQKQGLKIGRNRLFKWLRGNGYLRRNNEPYQQYMTNGYFVAREYTYFVGDEPKVGIKTYVTGKGQQYLYNKLTNACI